MKEERRETERERKKGGCLTQIQAFNKSSSNNNKQSFHVAWLINQAFFFDMGSKGAFSSFFCLVSLAGVWVEWLCESFYVGCLCLYAARFETEGGLIVHGLMRARPSFYGATGRFHRRSPATLMGYRKVVGKGTATFLHTRACAHKRQT